MTPGSNAGTGEPLWFKCAGCRRRGFSEVELTGKHRKAEGKVKRVGIRHGDRAFQYRCRCGHPGWSRHTDLESRARVQGLVP